MKILFYMQKFSRQNLFGSGLFGLGNNAPFGNRPKKNVNKTKIPFKEIPISLKGIVTALAQAPAASTDAAAFTFFIGWSRQ